MTVLAGLDFGTSSVKLLVVTSEGSVIGRAQAAYDTVSGPNGETEQQPDDWWAAAIAALRDCGAGKHIDVIGLTGQMQNLIPVADGRALRSAMLYSDTRAGVQFERLRSELPNWEGMTGNHQDVSTVVAKIAWLVENEPEVLDAAEHLLLSAHGYFAWRAGGDAACDVTTASTTGLLDVDARAWSAVTMAAAGSRVELLPSLVGSSAGGDVVGIVSEQAGAELGLRAGIPIVLAMGDAASTTDGLVGSSPGDAYLYLGTTGWLAGVTEVGTAPPSPIHSLVMPGWNHRLRIGAVQSAGSAAAWARETFLHGLNFDDVERHIADRVEETAARPLCLPGIAGERTPIRDGAFRGAFVGVQEASDQVDFYLAVLTGVAMGLRHASDEMGIRQNRIPLVGGAATSTAWRRILADVFGATIVTRATTDPGTYAAARAAASALGLTHQLRPLFEPSSADVETPPSANRAKYETSIATHRGLYEALAPSFHQLAR